MGSNGTGDLQTGGSEIAARYNYPLSDGIPINRPFDIDVNDTGNNPDHFLQAPYGAVYSAGVLSQFYDHSVQTSSEGSALVTLTDSGNVAFLAVNGISMAGTSGTNFMANWSLMTVIQSFLAAGRYNPGGGYANHIEQVPRIHITSPNASSDLTDPSSIVVGWEREWLRWDGQSYTTLYSDDQGGTWKYMQDNSAAIPGVRPSGGLLISTASATPTYTWNVPAGNFPQGTYLIRVEAYRDALPLHYAHHQYSAFVRRG
jgi:hypothetical protein